jgi:hypothetical protein
MSFRAYTDITRPGAAENRASDLQQTAVSPHRDTSNGQLPDDRDKITVENAYQALEWYEEYGVLICIRHRYAVRNLSFHLQEYHTGNAKERSAILELFCRYPIREPRDVTLPVPLGAPFASLGKPVSAFICQEPECQYISISRKGIRLHCNLQRGSERTGIKYGYKHSSNRQVYRGTLLSYLTRRRTSTIREITQRLDHR